MNIKPLADRVLIKPTPAEERTISGIIIPEVNDVVMFGKYAGTEIELDGEKLMIMRQSDILAIIND